jgi:hypothetical protein
MPSPSIALTLEIRSQDGSCTEFFQSDSDLADRTLGLLAGPRLFSQPLLVLASEDSASMIRSHTVDMVLARTSTSISAQWPPGLSDIVEVASNENSSAASSSGDSEADRHAGTLRIHLYTAGGWAIALELTPDAQLTLPDQRVLLAHFFNLPVIPFRLLVGGLGFINPAQIMRATGQLSTSTGHVSKFPGLNAVPNTALPVHFLRWTPRSRAGRLSASLGT